MLNSEQIKQCERVIGYEFKDKSLMETALSHPSYAYENNTKSNQRLEFLGDAVLSAVVATKLFFDAPNVGEGDLTKLRATIVSERGLDIVADKMGLEHIILLGNSGRSMKKAAIKADAFEAVLAAIYLDGGMDTAREWLLNIMHEEIDNAVKNGAWHDYKSELQELVQKQHTGDIIAYRKVSEKGPEHNKRFCMEVLINNRALARGEDTTKKGAEQKAAAKAYAILRKEYNEAL